MSVERGPLAALANKLASTILDELQLDGVIVKIHLGEDAASCGVTSRERAPRVLDDIVYGEVEAMGRYAREVYNAREMGGVHELPQPDGSTIRIETGERKDGQES